MQNQTNRRNFLSLIAGSMTLSTLSLSTAWAEKSTKPNIIVIFADDMGYGDLSCFGSEKHRTPNIDQMAREGMRLTSFYVTSGVCTPSRSSLMTGCYPRRVNMHVSANNEWVLFPVAKKGLNPSEITIAEILKKEGYATACIGKWHLGDQPQFLPTRQGFDSYFGIPYSNDMGAKQRKKNPPLPLLRNEKVIEAPVDQTTITKRYTKEAVKFITKNKENPFFLYFPHTMPHNPVNSSEKFKGKSANGGYGDSVEEIDWSVGELLATLKKQGIDDNTLVLFTSDNGAAKRWGGSNAPLSGWKGSTSEGGMRVPCVVRWPGKIPAGKTCSELCSTIDLLPTFSRLANTVPPIDRIIDGKDILPLLRGEPNVKSPHNAFYYYFTSQLQAVRSGNWKLWLPREFKKKNSEHQVTIPLKLYNLSKDIAEQHDVSAQHPDIVKRLTALAETASRDLGNGLLEGQNQRPSGLTVSPKPLRFE